MITGREKLLAGLLAFGMLVGLFLALVPQLLGTVRRSGYEAVFKRACRAMEEEEEELAGRAAGKLLVDPDGASRFLVPKLYMSAREAREARGGKKAPTALRLLFLLSLEIAHGGNPDALERSVEELSAVLVEGAGENPVLKELSGHRARLIELAEEGRKEAAVLLIGLEAHERDRAREERENGRR